MSNLRTSIAHGDNADAENPSRQRDSRARQRNNLFVSAVLSSDNGYGSAIVRNLSETGALVEAPVLPPPGTKIRLRRAGLEVPGTIVWQNHRRAGLKFQSPISVDDWLPGAARKHQALVDRMVDEVRTKAVAQPSSEAGPEEVIWNAEKIATLIERIAARLSGDDRIVAEHSEELQQLEIAVQHLRRLPY